MTSYQQSWGGSNPGCLILLLDQSGSMSDPFGFSQAGGGRRKCDMVATVLNSFLNELIVTNTVAHKDGSSEVRPRADVAVLSYEGNTVTTAMSGSLGHKDFVSLAELQAAPIEIEQRKRKEIDETGQEIELSVPFPIWVKPTVGAGTPMCAALRRACDLAQTWADTHPANYPPVIINVTDGMATDGNADHLAQTAADIRQVTTSDGSALLFNVHITDINMAPIIYPASESELPNDKYARILFSISSTIPESSRKLLIGKSIEPGARGLIFNGDAASVRQMFTFASVPGTQPLDPDR